jgi:hypothetical protein
MKLEFTKKPKLNLDHFFITDFFDGGWLLVVGGCDQSVVTTCLLVSFVQSFLGTSEVFCFAYDKRT